MPAQLTRLVGVAAAAAAVVLATTVLVQQPPPWRVPTRPTSPAAFAVRGRPVPAGPARVDAVRALLTNRARALGRRDRAAWLATIDPASPGFRLAQGRLFDALTAVPVVAWTYELDPLPLAQGPTSAARHGAGWWAATVTLRYRLAGFDGSPSAQSQHLTFVLRDGRWYLADADSADGARGIWDGGPVVAVRGRSTLVLGHPASRRRLAAIAADVDAAVGRVSEVWGTGWSQRVVVLVPSSGRELRDLVGGGGDYSHIAAVTTTVSDRGPSGVRAGGDRVVINPDNFARLGALGRRVVLTHEVTHVATRAATGTAAPSWLVEGFADYVGYRGVQLPEAISAEELQRAVRHREIPSQLPTDGDFAGSNPALAQVYEQAWLAVRLIAQQYGQDGLVRLYRTVGRGRSVDASLGDLFGIDTARLTAAWRRDLVQRLG